MASTGFRDPVHGLGQDPIHVTGVQSPGGAHDEQHVTGVGRDLAEVGLADVQTADQAILGVHIPEFAAAEGFRLPAAQRNEGFVSGREPELDRKRKAVQIVGSQGAVPPEAHQIVAVHQVADGRNGAPLQGQLHEPFTGGLQLAGVDSHLSEDGMQFHHRGRRPDRPGGGKTRSKIHRDPADPLLEVGGRGPDRDLPEENCTRVEAHSPAGWGNGENLHFGLTRSLDQEGRSVNLLV